jgi:hypothetical protein
MLKKAANALKIYFFIIIIWFCAGQACSSGHQDAWPEGVTGDADGVAVLQEGRHLQETPLERNHVTPGL